MHRSAGLRFSEDSFRHGQSRLCHPRSGQRLYFLSLRTRPLYQTGPSVRNMKLSRAESALRSSFVMNNPLETRLLTSGMETFRDLRTHHSTEFHAKRLCQVKVLFLRVAHVSGKDHGLMVADQEGEASSCPGRLILKLVGKPEDLSRILSPVKDVSYHNCLIPSVRPPEIFIDHPIALEKDPVLMSSRISSLTLPSVPTVTTLTDPSSR